MRDKILPEMKALEAELKALKKTFRDPLQQPPKLKLYWDIDSKKHRATILYCAIAHSRGKIHRQKDTLEGQAEFISDFLDQMEMAA